MIGKKNLSLYFPLEVMEWLEETAREDCCSKSSVVRKALKEYKKLRDGSS